MGYDMAEDMEPGTGVMHLVLGVIFPLAPLFLLRGQAREKSGIEGGAVGDFCTVLCCPGCAHLQQYKEVNPQKSLVCGESTVERKGRKTKRRSHIAQSKSQLKFLLI